MTLIELDAQLREYYTKNKEGKGGGYGGRLIQQYINYLPTETKLTKAIEALKEIAGGKVLPQLIAQMALTELKQQP